MPHTLSLDIDSSEHERWVKKIFPSLGDSAYFQSAGRGPMPCKVVHAMQSLVGFSCGNPMDRPREEPTLQQFKAQAAGLIGARKDEIAFVTSTTTGIGLIANAIDWKKGDRILLADVEYPANIIPWVKIANEKGAVVDRLKSKKGLVDLAEIEKKITDRTRAFPLSIVQFASGQRLDVEQISRICDDHGTLLFLDAIQALGAMRFDLRKVNAAALSAGGYKWLCGPLGSGILYVNRTRRDEFKPASVAWRSLEESQRKSLWERIVRGGNLIDDEISSEKDASAFELSTDCYIQMFGLSESIKFLRSIGIGRIQERIHRLNDYFMERLDESGFKIMTPRERSDRAGIVSFKPKRGIDEMADAAKITMEIGRVKLAIRGGAFRAATHFFNSKQDIDAALAAVSDSCEKRGLI